MRTLKHFIFLNCALLLSSISFAQQGYLEQPPTTIYSDHRLLQNSKAAAESSNGILIFGAPLSNSYILGPLGLQGGNSSGAVRYFIKDNITQAWTSHNILPFELAASDNFGTSVGATHDHLIVGVLGDDDMGSASGSALIYERNIYFPDQFYNDPSKKLLASDGAANDFFGTSVSISNNWALVGASGNDDLGSSSGSAYLFERNQGGAENWGLVIKLLAPDGGVGNIFGHEVKISDTTAFVSAPGAQKVYIFNQNAGGPNNWGHVKTITPSIPSSSFGSYISVLNDLLVVGSNAERVFVYEMNSGGTNNWGELQVLIADPGEVSQYFGRSVEINKNQASNTLNVFVGARRMNHKGNDSGAVYWFQRINSDPLVKKRIISASDVGATMEFGYFVLAQESDLFIGRLTNSGEVSYYNASSSLGTVAPSITGLVNEYSVPDNLPNNLFSQTTVQDTDPTNLEASIRLTNPTIGAFASPFVQKSSGLYYYTGTRNQVNSALQNLMFTPTNNLGALESFTSSDLTIKVDDFINEPFLDTVSLKSISSNEPPQVTNLTLEVYVDQTIGSNIGTVTATDPDIGQSLSFSITNGNPHNLFSINNSGTISLSNTIDPIIDGTTFQMEIRATDNYALDPKFGVGTATINLRDSILYNRKTKLAPEPVSFAGVNFGRYVTVSNDFAVIANTGYNGTTPAKVYLYSINETNELTLLKELTPQSVSFSYGERLTMNNEWLFLGDPFNDELASNAGAVAVFSRNEGGNNNWGFIKNITIPGMTSNSYFGYHVKLVGDQLFVSARSADTPAGTNTGAVFVFHKDQGGSNQWGLKQTIVASGLGNSDNFGSYISVSSTGNTLSICADQDDVSGINRGATYIFKQNENGDYFQSQKITNTIGSSDGWGLKASLQDSTMIIASTTNNTLGGIYEMNDVGNFVLIASIPSYFNYQYSQSFLKIETLNNNQIVISTKAKLQVWQKRWSQNSWGIIQQMNFTSLDAIGIGGNKVLIGHGGQYSDNPWQGYPNLPGMAYLFDLKSTIPNPNMTLKLDNISGHRLNETVVPVKIQCADEIVGLQFSLTWDPEIMEFVGLENFNMPGLNSNSFNLEQVSDGLMTLAWVDPTLTGFSSTEESVIFNVRFKAIGNYADASQITISNNPTTVLAVDVDYANINIDLVPGSFTINNAKTMTGTVLDIFNNPVSATLISLTDIDGVISGNNLTNEEGQYAIPITLNDSTNVLTFTPGKVEPSINLDLVDVADVASTRRHILNVQLFSSPYQFIAADVVEDGAINIIDLVDLQSVLIGKTNQFFGGRVWTFVPAEYNVENISTPITYPKVTQVSLNGAIPDEVNFTAIRLGDVTIDNVDTGGKISSQEIVFEYSEPILVSNDQYIVNFKSSGFKNISALQFTIGWNVNDWEFNEFQSPYLISAALGKNKLDNGELAVVWDHNQGTSTNFAANSTVFSIFLIRKNSSVFQNDILTFDDNISRKKAYDGALKNVSMSFLFNPSLEENDPDTRFYPNPLTDDVINIGFNSEISANGTFMIIASDGRLVRKKSIAINPGYNLLNFEGLETLRKGVYVFSLITGKRTIRSVVVKH